MTSEFGNSGQISNRIWVLPYNQSGRC